MRLSFLRGITIAIAALTGVMAVASGPASQTKTTAVTSGMKGALELSRAEFVSNAGQWNAAARYLAQVPGLAVWVTDRGLKFDHYQVINGASGYRKGQAVSMEIKGLKSGFVHKGLSAKRGARVFSKNGRLIQTSAYSEVFGETLDKSAALRTYVQGTKARYDLLVRPGMDPSKLELAFKGATKVVAQERSLALYTVAGKVLHQDLVAYQNVNGKRVHVPARFVAKGNDTVGFKLGAYDRSRELVIDPLVYGTYVGGNGASDEVRAVQSDADGGVYLVGRTSSSIFPVNAGPYGFSLRGAADMFVTKLEGDAYALTYAAYIGGAGNDLGQFARLDPSGHLWVAGTSTSRDFPGDRVNAALLTVGGTPTAGNYRISYTVGATTEETADIAWDADAATINAALRALPLLGTRVQVNRLVDEFGTRFWIEGFGQDVNARGSFAVSVSNVTGGFALMSGAPNRIFVMRFRRSPTLVLDVEPNEPKVQTFYATGTAAQTTLGGFAMSPIAVPGTDAADMVIAGNTSRAFPMLSIAEPAVSTGYYIRFNYSDSRWFRWGTGDYTSNVLSTVLSGIDIDTDGNLGLAGTVATGGNVDTGANPVFITTSNVFAGGRVLKGSDIWVRKYSPSGSLTASALVGGSEEDFLGGIVRDMDYTTNVPTGSALAFDVRGNMYVTGVSASFDYPRTRGVFGETFSQSPTMVVTKLSPDLSSIVYSTNLRDNTPKNVTGGDHRLVVPAGINVDSQGAAYITGLARARVTMPAASSPGDPNQPAAQTFPTIQLTPDAVDPAWTSPASPEMPTTEGFLTVLNSTGTNLQYSTFVGGGGNELIFAPYVDGFGDVWVCGRVDGRRDYARVSSTGTPTIYPNGSSPTPGLPPALLSPLAFKANMDIGPGPSVTQAYANQAEPGPFANFPNTVPTDAVRDGFVVKLRVGLPAVRTITLAPNTIPGGQPNTAPNGAPASTVGTVTLSGPAPAGGATVQLTLSNLSVSSFDAGGLLDQTSITIPVGQTVGTFQVFSKPTSVLATSRVRATYQNSFQEALLTVIPWLRSIQLAPLSVVGGNPVAVRVTLNQVAPVGGASVSLSSNDPSLVTFNPATIVIPAGADTAVVDATTLGVDANSQATITASLLNFQLEQTVTITPATVTSVRFNPPRVATGGSSDGSVQLNGAAGPSGVAGTLSATTGGVLGSNSFTIAAQARTGAFTVDTDINTAAAQVNVTASTTARGSAIGTLFLDNFTLSEFTIAPPAVDSGATSVGRLVIPSPAPAGGVTVNLSVPSGSPVVIPAQVVILEGDTTLNFNIGTRAVTAQTVVTVTAARSGTPLTANLTIRPATLALRFSPTSVVGGVTNSTGTVELSGPAPVGGMVVNLSSPNAAVSVPPSVTVAAGNTTATFVATTAAVSSTVSVPVTATTGALSTSASLEVRNTGLLGITLAPGSVRGGSTTPVTLVVTLDGPAPVGGFVVNLSYTSSSLVGPSSITIPAGATSATRTNLATRRVSRDVTVTATATAGSRTASASMTIRR